MAYWYLGSSWRAERQEVQDDFLARQSKTGTRQDNRVQIAVNLSIGVADGSGNQYTEGVGDGSGKQFNGVIGFKIRH